MATIKELRDSPSIFAEVILGIMLHEGQKKILECRDRFIAVRAARRFGKSYVFSCYAAWYAATHPNSVVVVLSKSQRQSTLMFQTIAGLIRGSPLAESVTNDTQTLLKFSNGSTIQALPGASPDALRGFTINLALVDESAYAPDQLFTVLYPALTSTKGTLVQISSPGFSAGEFYRACQPNSEFTKFHFTHDDAVYADGTPFLDPEEIEREAQRIGGKDSPEFIREWLAEFSDAQGAFFQLEAIEKTIDEELEPVRIGLKDRKYALGLDCGFTNDFTVSSIIDYTDPENLQIVEMQRYTHVTPEEIAFKVGEQSARFDLTRVLVDNGNAGQAVIDAIKNNYSNLRVFAFNFNKKTKPAIMMNMARIMNRGELTMPNYPAAQEELASLVYKENPETKYMKIAANGNGHDDIPISIALAIEAANLKKRGSCLGIASANKRVGFNPEERPKYENRLALV